MRTVLVVSSSFGRPLTVGRFCHRLSSIQCINETTVGKSHAYLTKRLPTRRHFFGSSKQNSSSGGNSNNNHYYSKFEREDPGLKWTATISHPAPVAGPEGIPSRAEQIQKLQETPEKEYDVLVIGGGATGAGIALDAATRGLSTACIERGDFASETSSRSTKLIWAGLKYMGTATAELLTPSNYWKKGPWAVIEGFYSELKMVYHCHVERHYMTTVNPHLCNWVAIAVPFKSWLSVPSPMGFPLYQAFPMVAPLVFKVYDALSGFACPPSYVMGKQKTEQLFPQLDTTGLKYTSVFYEAQHNDSRTNLAIALTAAEKGATIANYVAATQLVHNSSTGAVEGAVVVDRMTNKQFTIRAKHVVFAGGPFTDGLRRLEVETSGDDKDEEVSIQPAVRGASGTHLVLPGSLVPKDMGLLDPNTSDGRFLFILPWQGHTLIGTTDDKCPAETLPSAPKSDTSWILQESGKYWKEELKPSFCRENVTSAWRGWRPLAVDPHAAPDAPASRDHVISENPDTKCIFIAGGKWTTWREMAQDVVDRLTPTKCQTLEFPLLGGAGYSDTLAAQVKQKYPFLDQDVCEHVVKTYAGRVWDVCGEMENNQQLAKRLSPSFPYVEAEVGYACREYAVTIEDILSRRTRLAYLDRDAALAALPRVADIMAKELKWTKHVKKEQMAAAQAYVESFGGGSSPE